MQTELEQRLNESVEVLKAACGAYQPTVGIILGSGLGGFAHKLEGPVCVPFASVPHMKTSTATSHVGQFVCGMVEGHCVLVAQGRLHGYEGYTAQEVAYPVWLMHKLGIDVLITTNAAGAINETYSVGDFCLMADHINLTGRNPLVGTEPDALAPRFVSLFEAYCPRLRALARSVAESHAIAIQEGTYLALLGPSFETPAEIHAFRTLGADTVAMSVAEEAIAARHVGMRVLGISLVTNMACGIEGASPNDDEVIDVAVQQSESFALLLSGIIAGL